MLLDYNDYSILQSYSNFQSKRQWFLTFKVELEGTAAVLGAALGNVAGTAAAALGTGTAEVRGLSIAHAPRPTRDHLGDTCPTWRKEPDVRRALTLVPSTKATTDDANRRATQRDPYHGEPPQQTITMYNIIMVCT
jgi:hypothetical protein